MIFDFTKSAAPQELKDSINQKSREFQQINTQIKTLQKGLEETQDQGKTLQKEIKKLDTTISQVSLGIRSSEITIDKLGLEIESLSYDIDDAEKEIISKREIITKTIQELQRSDHETTLVIFLKNKSLADSVLEAQNIFNLNSGLAAEIESLRQAKEELSDKLTGTADKKEEVETENNNLKNKKVILGDTKKDRQSLLKQTKNQEQIYQKTLSELEKKQAEIADQIERLEEELRLKIDPSALPTKRPGVLARPVVGGSITQGYGATTFARYGYRGKWHNGTDFSAPIGTPVLAAEKGRVILVENQDRYCNRGAYGKLIVIEHENNLTTLYAHLSLQSVREGDIVNRGQIIGYSGKTGYATGPHLHLTVYASQTFIIKGSRLCGPRMPFGGDLNPLDYL